MTKKEPFSLKINYELNSTKLKKLFKKSISYILIFGSGSTIVHGTINPAFYLGALKKFGILLTSVFK